MWSFNSIMLFSVLVNGLLKATSANQGQQCKPVPGSPNWPSPSSWESLNTSLSGQLLQLPPTAAVCHPSLPQYNAAACTTVTQGWTNIDFHADDPMSVPWNNFNNDTCLPDPNVICTGEGYPVYVVNATCSGDVKKGVDFARENEVRLIVKGSGHDYVGRSSAPNSLSIWTRYIKGITFHDSFKPQGCKFNIDGPSVTVGAGVPDGDANLAASLRNLTLLTTGEESVGYGGYITGGGHSALAPAYGLIADVVLEMELVTPDGDIVKINECQNQDLFWAMRGGGGSTFGVMTQVTMKAFPSVPVIVITYQAGTPAGQDIFFDGITWFFSQYPYLSANRISGYHVFSRNTTYNGSPISGWLGEFIMPVLSPANTTTSLQTLVTNLLGTFNTTWPNQFITGIYPPKVYDQFYDWWYPNNGPKYAGQDSLVGSRLLGEKALMGDKEGLRTALEGFISPDAVAIHVGGGRVLDGNAPRGGGNSVNPAWRKTYLHLTNGVSWSPFNATEKAIQSDLLTNTKVEAMRKFTPDMGAYVNEADVNEPDFQHEFWGEHYERLLDIKRRVDPKDVFWCHPCVGNERWREVGDLLCRV